MQPVMDLQMQDEYVDRCDSLLKRAYGGQWDPDERLNWRQPPVLVNVSVSAPLVSERMQAAWPAMPSETRAAVIQQLLGSLLANLAVGEKFVDDALNDLRVTLPHEKLREILAMQLVDEDRHNKVLRRFVHEYLGWQPTPGLHRAAAENLEAATEAAMARWETRALLVMVLEIAATAAIQGMRSYCDEPLLQGMLKGIVGDESRHISGLTLSLRAYQHNWDDELRSQLKETALLGWLQGLAVTERPACDMADWLDSNFATAPERPTENWPFFRQTLADILVPKLKILGLLDEDLAARLREAGCPVPELSAVAAA